MACNYNCTNDQAIYGFSPQAGRVKNILSANTHSFAQIENVMEEIDLRQRINRDTVKRRIQLLKGGTRI